jgi:DNA-binding response OmpR family regulator
MNTLTAADVQAPSSILWIDDEVTGADAGVCLIALAGFRVECAGSGAEGLRRAVASRHSAIILDLRLPDIDGLSVGITDRSEYWQPCARADRVR